MPDLGRAALIVTFGLLVYATIGGGYAAFAGRRRLAQSARNALVAAFATTVVASAVLLEALVSRDFSFEYVARTSSRDLPLAYAISAFWGGQAGSLLLWLLLLSGFSVVAVGSRRRLPVDVISWVVPVLSGIGLFFAAVLVFVESPFGTQVAPADGAGLNPSLQNPYMLIHPVLLYLGFVGMSVPFAFAIGGLLARRADELWVVATRRWMLAAWMFLGIGQLLGARWAYLEIGWGGYYGWDPVENAALMPWLTATAYLHSIMVQEKKGMLRVWNVLLVILTFELSILATLLTRSGLLESVHAFAMSQIGPWFVAFLAITTTVSLVLVFRRLPLLRTRTRLESPLSREAAFLYNNLLLVAFCLTILWGVLYPLISEAVRGEPITVSGPYYNFFLRSFGLPLLLLMGVGPLIAWRRASIRSLGRTFFWPLGAALVTGAALAAAGAASSPAGLIAYSFSAFVLAAIVLEFARGTRARAALTGDWSGHALLGLIAHNRRRYGGYVVHASVVLFAIGVAGSSAYQTVREATLLPGETMTAASYRLRLDRTVDRQAANHTSRRALLSVTRDGRPAGTLEPGKNVYPVTERQPLFSTEVAIRRNWLRAEDLYVVTDQMNADGSVDLTVYVKPLVNLLWIGGFVFILGSLIALWPDAREQRRLAVRYAERDAFARA
ncbi:MAG: heme lyase CcmF/NrfE family subunit [Actinomycetota bacterium]|nr:heme lyase CcmF/NrfE family subunit [Actinomycetota bacterium]